MMAVLVSIVTVLFAWVSSAHILMTAFQLYLHDLTPTLGETFGFSIGVSYCAQIGARGTGESTVYRIAAVVILRFVFYLTCLHVWHWWITS